MNTLPVDSNFQQEKKEFALSEENCFNTDTVTPRTCKKSQSHCQLPKRQLQFPELRQNFTPRLVTLKIYAPTIQHRKKQTNTKGQLRNAANSNQHKIRILKSPHVRTDSLLSLSLRSRKMNLSSSKIKKDGRIKVFQKKKKQNYNECSENQINLQ